MSALAMILAAGMMMGDGPAKVSGEYGEKLDLSGTWEGNISHQEGTSISAGLDRGHLGEWVFVGNGPIVTASYRASVSGEGAGLFRLSLDGKGYAGIYKWGSGGVILCFRPAEQGRPMSFRAGDGQHLLILRRVKTAK